MYQALILLLICAILFPAMDRWIETRPRAVSALVYVVCVALLVLLVALTVLFIIVPLWAALIDGLRPSWGFLLIIDVPLTALWVWLFKQWRETRADRSQTIMRMRPR